MGSGAPLLKSKTDISSDNSPLEAIITWFDARPPEIQQTLGYFIMTRLPNGELIFERKYYVSKLREWVLGDHDKRPMVQGARAVMFRALVNFTCRKYFSKEGWKDMIETHEWIREHAYDYFEQVERPDEMVNIAANMLQEAPFRRAAWLKSAGSWQRLCAAELSDESLDRFSRL